MPDATPTFTAPPSRARRPRRWFVLQVVVTGVVLWFVGRRLFDQWTAFRAAPSLDLHPKWMMVGVSCVIVLGTYAVLIETWRRIVVAWGAHLTFGQAARIWFVSNLARYLPGINQVFVVGAMAELARRGSISPTAAAGAALINTAVNIASGFVIALLAGFTAIDTLSSGHATLGIWIAVVLLGGLLALPALLPRALDLAQRLTGRRLNVGVLPRRAIYISMAGNVVAWTLYGLAFEFFVRGILGHNAGNLADYIAVWAGAYVIGYLAFLVPAGLGAREGALASGLTMLHLAALGAAGVIALAARLWLTVLEIVPALVYLARGARPRPHDTTPRDGSIH